MLVRSVDPEVRFYAMARVGLDLSDLRSTDVCACEEQGQRRQGWMDDVVPEYVATNVWSSVIDAASCELKDCVAQPLILLASRRKV